MMRRSPLLFAFLALPACGGVELQSDFAEDILVPQYAEIALQVHAPFALSIGTASELDQPALDRFGHLVAREVRRHGLRVIDEVETASSHLEVSLIVEHTRERKWIVQLKPQRATDDGGPPASYVVPDRSWGAPINSNEVWYIYVLSWKLNSIDRPLWVGTIRTRARYGGGNLEQGVQGLLELLFDGEERLLDV